MYRYWDHPYFFPFLPWFTFTIDILFFIFIVKNFMALPISLHGKHLTLPQSYPSIACALVHHSLQLWPFPDYAKLPDSYYLQCTTIRNIYRIFSSEIKRKTLPLKQIKFRKRRDSGWIFSELYCPAKEEEGEEEEEEEEEARELYIWHYIIIKGYTCIASSILSGMEKETPLREELQLQAQNMMKRKGL